MSPGRASSALTICRLFLPASALRTQVWTAAQPVPSILTPACSSDHVTKLAHHGLPGATLADARYLSTSAPVLTPCSCTPSWVCATFSAAVPALLPPVPVAAAAVASTMPGTDAGGAIALAGPAGAWAAMNVPEAALPPPAALAASALTAMKLPESPAFGGSGGAAAAAAAGAPGAAAAAAAGAGAATPGAGGAAAAVAAGAPPAVTSAGGVQLLSISPS